MAKVKATSSNSDISRPMRPALTPEAREQQMISLAMDLVEQRLRNGTASSQETTHFLKLATAQSQLEKMKLEASIKLDQAKIDNLESQSKSASIYQEALRAFKSYSGQDKENDEDE